MLSMTLLAMSYSMIEFDSILTIPVYAVILLAFFGLKETCVALADPFGGDDVDFDTAGFMEQVLANTKALISRDAVYKPGPNLEPPPESIVVVGDEALAIAGVELRNDCTTL